MDRLVTRVNDIADSDMTPGEKVIAYMVATFDTQIAELIRGGQLRESGFTEIADLLEQPTNAGRCGHLAPGLELLPSSMQPICALTAGHAGWHRSEDGCEWGVPTP